MTNIKETLSMLWIFVLFNMIFADLIGFMHPGALEAIISGNIDFEVTEELLLYFSFLLEIPIIMIVLSRLLERNINRCANLFAATITIIFVIVGGGDSLTYLFFASVEIIAMSVIFLIAWSWPKGLIDNR